MKASCHEERNRTGDAMGYPSPDCEYRDQAIQTRFRHPSKVCRKRYSVP